MKLPADRATILPNLEGRMLAYFLKYLHRWQDGWTFLKVHTMDAVKSGVMKEGTAILKLTALRARGRPFKFLTNLLLWAEKPWKIFEQFRPRVLTFS